MQRPSRLHPLFAADLRHDPPGGAARSVADALPEPVFPNLRHPSVSPGRLLVIDRHRLDYLNGSEKLNGVFCGYANRLNEHAAEITGRTEEFRCPIKDAQRTRDPNRRTNGFVDSGDASAYTREPPTAAGMSAWYGQSGPDGTTGRARSHQ